MGEWGMRWPAKVSGVSWLVGQAGLQVRNANGEAECVFLFIRDYLFVHFGVHLFVHSDKMNSLNLLSRRLCSAPMATATARTFTTLAMSSRPAVSTSRHSLLSSSLLTSSFTPSSTTITTPVAQTFARTTMSWAGKFFKRSRDWKIRREKGFKHLKTHA